MMSLSNGRPYLAIPGPSVMPDRVLNAMHQPSPNIYGTDIAKMVAQIVVDLKTVARTKQHAAIYICNGHGAWEAALANTVALGDKVLVLATGRFGIGWSEVASARGLDVELVDCGNATGIDLARVTAALQADNAHEIKAIMAVHVDTSTSVRNDIRALRSAIDRAGHPALLMVDCIASLGCDRFEMDDWGVDVTVAVSQKGLMTPPGLAFVFFSDKAKAVRENMTQVSQYWDWTLRADPHDFYQYFGGTAPTHHLFALREALQMLVHEEGIEAVWARHGLLAQGIWAAFEAWGDDGGAPVLNITEPAERCHAVTLVHIGAPDGTALRDWVEERAGVTLGIGIGMVPHGDPAWHGYFRIGHMGHLNAHMVLGMLGAIEAGMVALGIKHGGGGLAAAAAVFAKA